MSERPSWKSPHGRPLPPVGQRTLIMGILNVTPDSFSDGGELSDTAAVVKRARALVEAGSDVLDVGGESTRPGATPVGECEELARVLPAIRALRAQFPQTPISVDTFKPHVAEAAIRAGADMVNDVWGFTHGLDRETRDEAAKQIGKDPFADGAARTGVRSLMAQTVARLQCPVVLMHNRPDRNYRRFWPEFTADLRLSLALAAEAGISREQIWLDPGFGFAKSAAQNLEVVKRLDRVVRLGYPVLLGTSRKSTLGKVLGTTVEDRVEGTGATVVWGIERGCAMVRVHDVAAMKRFAVMADAIKAGLAARVEP